jgi:hypothetical protein
MTPIGSTPTVPASPAIAHCRTNELLFLHKLIDVDPALYH